MADVEFKDIPEDTTPPAGAHVVMMDLGTTSVEWPSGTPLISPAEKLPISDAATTALAGKAASVHTHVIGDTAGLQAALDAKQAAGSYATAAQGAKADTALQPAGNGGSLTGLTKAQVGLSAVPNVDATARSSHTGTQAASTISDLAATLASYLGSHLLQGSNVTLTQDPGTGAITIATTGGASLPTTTEILKGDGSGGAVAATSGTDFVAPGGVAGGQTIRGDTASGGNLSLSSTSHATKGLVDLDSNIRLPSGGEVYFSADRNQPSVHNSANGTLTLWNSGAFHDFALLQFSSSTTTTLRGGTFDGAGALAVMIDSQRALSDPSARIVAFANGGVAKAYIDFDGGFRGKKATFQAISSTGGYRDVSLVDAGFVSPTDATRTGYWSASTSGYNGNHETIRGEDQGTFSQPIIPLANLRDAADDSAAATLTPAVPVGGLYRTGSVLKVRAS